MGDPRLPTPVRLDGDPATGRQWRSVLAEFHRLGFGAIWQASTRYNIAARLLGVPYIDHWTYVTGRQAERLAATLSGTGGGRRRPRPARGQGAQGPPRATARAETETGRVRRYLA